ncbi:MAG: phosphoribosylaminoimidazole-succinocarboxamide synthase [Thermoplasmata archaeon]|jgi:phosphoribosylaminoimidazole-succinocarboxamide synthase|nr:phosphoribosylaminoimidazole-succinocarboxamide synthase [Thermoplasmata archaeon]
MAQAAASSVVTTTDLPFKVFRKGKVRDVYDISAEMGRPALLMVATDRISAFDVVLEPGIPLKGACLTQMSNFWFDLLKDEVPNHLIETDVARFPKALQPYSAMLKGRAVIVEKLTPLPVECIARGHISGSGWKEYRKAGTVCGIKLPPGLKESARLPETLFTPSTKADEGHDENITFEQCVQIVGRQNAEWLRRTTIRIYEAARNHAANRGIIIADTKFEFGTRADGSIVLMDEILTPDSSRFWPMDQFAPGGPQPSFDKQFLRDWLETQPWDKTPPGPKLPPNVVEGTAKRYYEAYERITGKPFKV